jgi:hypothetical protein
MRDKVRRINASSHVFHADWRVGKEKRRDRGVAFYLTPLRKRHWITTIAATMLMQF